MNKFTRFLCFAVMALMCCVQSWAGTPTMNQPFNANNDGFDFGDNWGNITIPAEYFLSDAVEVRLNVTGAQEIIFKCNGTEVQHYKLYNGEALDVTYVVKGDELTAARNGKFSATASTSAAILTITNMNAQGLEDEKNQGGNTGGNSGDGGNTGGSSSTKTLAEKIASKEQLTNIPTVYLTVPDAVGKDINSVLTKTGNDAEYHKATIKVVDGSNKNLEFEEDKLDIKVRGNSTANDSKKPYRLKFGKDEKDAEGNVIKSHKHDMLGNGYQKRNWTLLTNHKDASMLRNAITYHVGKAVGMDFCPGYRFVDLVINDEYRGTYQISDHVEVGNNRIELDDEDTGWFIESARGDMVEEPKVEAGGLQASIKNPEPATTAETTALQTEVANYIKKMNSYIGMYSTACSEEEFRDPITGWRSVIDEESFVKFYIGINLTDDYDGFMTVKMYRDVDGKMKFGPLWDKDLAYGNWENHGKLCEEYQLGYTFCNYAQKLATDPVFIKKVHDRFHAMVDAGYANTIKAKIEDLKNLLIDSQALNQGKWWTSADYPADVKTLSDYIDTRVDYLLKTWDKMYEDMGGSSIVDNTNPSPCSNHTFTTDNYSTDDDGILHRTCSKCGAAESDVNYYEFTVYPESATSQKVVAKSWTPSEGKPNSIALVSITPGLEASIEGYNIVNSKKNADGDQVCPDFRLTDGHPYYSDKKFKAKKATYTRQLGANEEYGTMILPYKYQNASVAGADFYHIGNVENGKVTLVAIDPSIEGNASAYTPVVFKRKNGASSITVEGEEISVKKSSADKFNSTCDGWTLTGTVENTAIAADGLYQFSKAQTGVISKVSSLTVAPFRAYFSTTSTAPNSLTIVSPAGEEVTILTLVNAIKQLNQPGSTIQKSDVESIANELLGK